MSKKTREQVAKLICGNGECFCSYDCGHSNKAPAASRLPLIGTETECPLARFHVTPDTRPWYERLGEARLTLEDCWDFCSGCEHASVDEDGTINLKDFNTVCIDCPVKAVMDNISEGDAEARMS